MSSSRQQSHYNKQMSAGFGFMASHMKPQADGTSARELVYEDVDDAGYSAPQTTGDYVAYLEAKIAEYELAFQNMGVMMNGRPVMSVSKCAEVMGLHRSSVTRRMQPDSRNRIDGFREANGRLWVYADQALTAAKRGKPLSAQKCAN